MIYFSHITRWISQSDDYFFSKHGCNFTPIGTSKIAQIKKWNFFLHGSEFKIEIVVIGSQFEKKVLENWKAHQYRWKFNVHDNFTWKLAENSFRNSNGKFNCMERDLCSISLPGTNFVFLKEFLSKNDKSMCEIPIGEEYYLVLVPF